jgi:hypothetical protein
VSGVRAVRPAIGIGDILPGSQFMDAYCVVVAAPGLDALDAARRTLGRLPRWAEPLMALRNVLVKPFGLKTGREPGDRREKIGIFPIESATPGRVVLGFDDRHLDFRGVVDVAASGRDSEVTLTTLVRLHGVPGRTYLTAIMPFHKLIVRTALAGLARTPPDQGTGRAARVTR